MSTPDAPLSRSYSAGEHVALRAVAHREWGRPHVVGEGPPYFAGGDAWPTQLRARAYEMARLLPLYLLAADALEREIAADPLTQAETSSPQIENEHERPVDE